jgi:hypothetical protein
MLGFLYFSKEMMKEKESGLKNYLEIIGAS